MDLIFFELYVLKDRYIHVPTVPQRLHVNHAKNLCNVQTSQQSLSGGVPDPLHSTTGIIYQLMPANETKSPERLCRNKIVLSLGC